MESDPIACVARMNQPAAIAGPRSSAPCPDESGKLSAAIRVMLPIAASAGPFAEVLTLALQ